MDPDDLERLIGAELKRLPQPRAPGSLLPRVLAAAAGESRPWYARPWLAWPLAWQITSAALFVALGVAVALLVVAWPSTHLGSGVLVHRSLGEGASRISAAFGQAAALARTVWQVLLGPAVFWLLAVALSLSLACALVWSALERATLGETR